MRLWSIHPKYLDRQGLLAVWRESLLAQSVLIKGEYTECPECLGSGYTIDNGYEAREICFKCHGKGKIKTPYYNHPQLERFKNVYNPSPGKNIAYYIKAYLYWILYEATKRRYRFKATKLKLSKEWMDRIESKRFYLSVTQGQLDYEVRHLQKKLLSRDFEKCCQLSRDKLRDTIIVHPLFIVKKGPIESWEKIK